MVEPVPGLNELVCELPLRVTQFGNAIEPLAKNIRQALKRKPRLSGYEFLIFDDLSRHMTVIAQALSHLSARIEGLMGNVFRNEAATMAEACREAGRLEQVLSELVDGYIETMASHAGPQASEARLLLLGVYRHHLREICRWLDEVVLTIADPAAAISRRGIPPAAGLEFSVVLNMTSPPQMAKLEVLTQRLIVPPETVVEPAPRFEQPASRRPGLLGTLGALAFGVGIAKAAMGRNHG